ncbi:MAG TPA: hypothetical protein VNU44_15805 [Bryobacteraceae bacterium]|jgi:predicted enzyme related to lactoylglutathione lyase|nr:hypothetical protein [Bryobacteraceae bacterium]
MAQIDRHAPGDLGAAVYAAPMMAGEGLRFAILADPQGAVFTLFSPVR